MRASPNSNKLNGAENSTLVHVEYEGDIAFLIIDNAPVNALSCELRKSLIERVSALSSDPTTHAIVLTGANDVFVAGADLREFGKPLSVPTLPDLIESIEACPKPVVAAIHGAALGGGYELALACDGRVAAPDAVVGLPEGKFGIIPGAGGTARITRLTDAVTAFEIVSSCRLVKALEAQKLGLVDTMAADLRPAAAAFARSLNGGKRRLRDLPPKPVDMEVFEKATQAALRRARGRPYAVEQAAALRRAFTQPFDQVLAEDRDVFQRLRDTDESAALRYLFFAEREAARIDGLVGVKPFPVNTVGVVGAGTMGAGIAAAFAAAGLSVTLVDSSTEVLETARGRIAGLLSRQVDPATLSTTTDLRGLSGNDLVIEAVFEDMGVKQNLLRELDGIVRPDAIVATNTSYLDLDIMAAATTRPERIVGLHFFAPAHIMKLLEIVRGAKTGPEILSTALKLGRALAKVAVVARVGEGFIGNRIYNAYRAQCEAMLLAGAMPQEIDSAIEAFGFAMGPFSVSDLSGLDIAWANRKRKQTATGDRSDVPVLEWLVDAGRLGRKTGAGWYRYMDGRRIPDAAVAALIEKARAERGVSPRTLTAGAIQDRALAAIVNEALLVLEDGIAARASDIDLVMVNGYGFPRQFGGPMYWAQRQDRAALEQNLALAGSASRRGNLALLAR